MYACGSAIVVTKEPMYLKRTIASFSRILYAPGLWRRFGRVASDIAEPFNVLYSRAMHMLCIVSRTNDMYEYLKNFLEGSKVSVNYYYYYYHSKIP